MKKLAFCCLAVLSVLTAAPRHAPAAFTLTLSQVGNNVVANGTGTINLAALTFSLNTTADPYFYPAAALLRGGASGSLDIYKQGGLTGPTSFGTGDALTGSSGTGSLAGIGGFGPFLYVPGGYVSGTLLTNTATFDNATFASLGFTPGTYTFTWGTGATADSLTVIGVPEPSALSLLGIGAIALSVVVSRRRRALH